MFWWCSVACYLALACSDVRWSCAAIELAFPARYNNGRQTVADNVDGGARHVHELIDSKQDESGSVGKSKRTDRPQQDHDRGA